MAAPRRLLLLSLSLSSVLLASQVHAQTATPAPVSAAEKQAAAAKLQLWGDFNHYVRIARVDLAQESGKALLAQTTESQLLDLVESSEYTDYETTLARAAKIDALKETAAAIAAKLQTARIARMRDVDRITADINRLGEGSRANANATVRLRSAGQYAAPALLGTLLDAKQARLHPYVMSAMISVGRPMVYPLATALPKLDAVQRAQVASVLSEIGYPLALPYLKLVLEDKHTTGSVKSVVQSAYDKLAAASGVPSNTTAAELFLTLGQNHYAAATAAPDGSTIPGYDTAQSKGILWEYTTAAGLVPVPLSGAIFGDVLAMRAAKQTLELNPEADAALSLWLAANLRRANRLGKDDKDISYSSSLQSPTYYLQLAGPRRQRDVLDRALEDGDTQLAINAISALGATAGSASLVSGEGGVQPILRALSYPDRRVRFAAAFVAAEARPKADFAGSNRVVPVLAEAVRQSDVRYALVLSPDETYNNQLRAVLKDLGYQTIAGTSLEAVSSEVDNGPGVDLVVMKQNADAVDTFRRLTDSHYKLSAVPIVAITSVTDQTELSRRIGNRGRVHVITAGADPAVLKTALETASKSYAGVPISPEEATAMAEKSLGLLRAAAATRSSVYKVGDAKSALIAALTDKRPTIVQQSASTLALLDDADAQRAIATAALDASKAPEMRLSLLGSLAFSAETNGNLLLPNQLSALLELVKSSKDDLSIASSRALGALQPPTSDLVGLITK